jgi:hypothetical protein
MSNQDAVLPRLLGDAFDRLDLPVRQIHSRASGEYRGTATVERGTSWLAQLACRLARLPKSAIDAPVRFTVDKNSGRETWSRYFSGSGPMVSTVEVAGDLLVEQLGPARLQFQLTEEAGVLLWQAVGLRVFGVPIPRRTYEFEARVRGRGARYRFEIDARMAIMGRLIRYQGVLDVPS